MSTDEKRAQTTFAFAPEYAYDSGEPPEDAARLVWMVLELVRRREIRFERHDGHFGRTLRTYRRDLKKLRELGLRFGFTIKRARRGVYVLAQLAGESPGGTNAAANEAAHDVLRAVVDALGDVVSSQLAPYINVDGMAVDPFLRLATPKLIAGSTVAGIYTALRSAWRTGAIVRFRYPARDGRGAPERLVEPYLTTYFAGRYYLVGFDKRPSRGGWRQYALDRIVGPIGRAGSFQRRPIPPEYRGEDAIGLFKTEPPVDVTISISPRIAAAIEARQWQRAQRCERDAVGGVTITLRVHDVGEAVRWALGFGVEARILAPPAAIALAEEIIANLVRAYSGHDDVRAIG